MAPLPPTIAGHCSRDRPGPAGSGDGADSRFLSRGLVGRWYEPLEIWRDWALDVSGRAVDSGHFLPEENPADTLAALLAFHATR